MPTALATPPPPLFALPSLSSETSRSDWEDGSAWNDVDMSTIQSPQSRSRHPHYQATQVPHPRAPTNPLSAEIVKAPQAQTLIQLLARQNRKHVDPLEVLQPTRYQGVPLRKHSIRFAPRTTAESQKQQHLFTAVLSSLDKEKSRLAEYRAPTIRIVESAPDVHCNANGFYLEPPQTVIRTIRTRSILPDSPPETPFLQVMPSTPESNPYDSFVYQSMHMSAVRGMEVLPPKEWSYASDSASKVFNPKHTKLFCKMRDALQPGYMQPELDVDTLLEVLDEGVDDGEAFEMFPVWYKRRSRYRADGRTSPCERLPKKMVAPQKKMKIRRRFHGSSQEPTHHGPVVIASPTDGSDGEEPSADIRTVGRFARVATESRPMPHYSVSWGLWCSWFRAESQRPEMDPTTSRELGTSKTFCTQAAHCIPYILMLLHLLLFISGAILGNIIVPIIILFLLFPALRAAAASFLTHFLRSLQHTTIFQAPAGKDHRRDIPALEFFAQAYKVLPVLSLGSGKNGKVGMVRHMCVASYGAVVGRMLLGSVEFCVGVVWVLAVVFVLVESGADCDLDVEGRSKRDADGEDGV